MLEGLWKLLGRKNQATSVVTKPLSLVSKPKTPPVMHPLSAESIYSYVTELDKNDSDRLREETRDRGLSFGDLRVDGAGGMSVTFRTPYDKTKDVSLDSVKNILRDVVAQRELVGVSVEDGKWDNTVSLLMSDSAPESLKGCWRSGWSKGKSYQERVFLEVNKLGGYPLSIEVYSAGAMEVALMLTRQIGLATEPALYANESDVPLSEIVEHAYVWHDEEADKYYVELKYKPELQKGLSYIGGGWNHDFEKDGKKIVVLASGYRGQQFKLNNVLVSPTRVDSPTHFMLETRDHIRNRERDRNTCKVDNCGRPVSYKVNVIRFEESMSIGDTPMSTSSHGSIIPVCDNPEHIEKVKTTSGGIRSTVQPARIEVW